jgi:hypothetical protein
LIAVIRGVNFTDQYLNLLPQNIRGIKMTIKECFGCSDNETCELHYEGSIAINECPCRYCLIKMVCQDPCEAILDHYRKVFSFTE